MPPLRGSVAGIVRMSSSAFQIGGSCDVVRPAGLETRDTADLEVRATSEWPNRRVEGIEWAPLSFCEAAADDVTPTGFVPLFVRFLQICHPYGVRLPASCRRPAALSKLADHGTSCG
jgi:hypothetical protein